MSSPIKDRLAVFLAALCGTAILAALQAKDLESKPAPAKPALSNAESPMPPGATTAVKPKALSANVKEALKYLVAQQNENGGWGQGGGWRVGSQGSRIEGAQVQDPPDVANTCIATLALLRAGNTPKDGPYASNVANAIEFICGHVEKSDKDSLYVTPVRGTQVQSKIGPYIDTFLTSLVLAEVKGRMANAKSEKRMVAALDKAIGKIERNMKEDGTFAGNNGWASVLSQGLCTKSLNRARQLGVKVNDATLARAERQATSSLDLKSGTFKAAAASPAGAPNDAGVPIYNAAAQNAVLAETVNTNKVREKKAHETIASSTATKDQKEEAKADLKRFDKAEKAQEAAVGGLVKQIEDKRFIAGFGSNGGEEFLSYMNISETLLVKGGPEWQKWDKSVAENLNRIQNKDGSWSGHHCITGRTFCTASALLVLMADRAPFPLAAKIKEKK